MTDEHEPTGRGSAVPPTAAPGAENAAEIGALRSLGLDALLGDEEGGGARWPDVEDRARRATRRRSQLAAVAAAIVLVLVVGAGALIARAGQESSIPAGPGGEPLYVLPPEGAAVVAAHVSAVGGGPIDPGALPVGPALSGYTVEWTVPSGNRIRLTVHRPDGLLPPPTTVDTVPRDRAELDAFVDAIVGSDPVEIAHHPIDSADQGVLDPSVFTCIGNPPDNAAPWVFGVAAATWITYVGADAERGPCGPGADFADQQDVLEATSELRLVGEDEWRGFMSSWIVATPTVTTVTRTPTTTIDPAVADYCAAIERFRSADLLDGDGNMRPESLPYMVEIRDAALDEAMRASYEVVIAWLEAGAPTPRPDEVRRTELPMTQDWIARCQGGTP
jgi:hypothetical protein